MITVRTQNSSFNLPAVNIPVKMDPDIGMDEESSIITHTNTHVLPEQTAHVEVIRLATHVESKKTGEYSQSNDDNPLVRCYQKVHSVLAITEFKKTLVELCLKDHIIWAMSVMPQKTDHSEVHLLATDTMFDVTGESKAHSKVQSTLVELTHMNGHEGAPFKKRPRERIYPATLIHSPRCLQKRWGDLQC